MNNFTPDTCIKIGRISTENGNHLIYYIIETLSL